MKIRISESSARSLVLPVVTMRVFYALAVDMPELYNSGWVAAVLGGILTLPVAWAAAKLRENCNVSPACTLTETGSGALWRIVAGMLAVVSAFDGAFVTSAIAGSASYIALNSISLLYLLLPQLILVGWCLMRSGDAIGAGAGIWNCIMPWLIALVIVLQLTEYRPLWLTPVFGPGITKILDGALRVSGWLSMTVWVFLIAEKEKECRNTLRPIRIVALCAAISAALSILRSMMRPALMDSAMFTRFFQLDALLSNGRSPLSLQMPIMVLWFVGLFFLLLYDALLCAAMIQGAMPGLKKRICVSAAILGISACILCGITSRDISMLASRFLYGLNGAVLAVVILGCIKGRRKNHA